jgi:3alpha(or 20beta)-hydroxysteroid dehydrogenase
LGSLDNKIVVITGAAQGMGEATAMLCVKQGAHVVVTDVNVEAGKAVARELGAAAGFKRLDVAKALDWEVVVRETIDAHGRIDGLVNNAGIFFDALIEDTEEDALRHLLDIDLIGPWLGMRAVVPHMKAARRGSIVNISSVEGLVGHCGRTAYTAAKWGLRAMTKSLAMEVGPFGVRVNAVQPGAIDTPMLRTGMAGTPFVTLFPEVAMNRPGRPEEVAAATVFLISDAASYISGADLPVDGAWTCGAYTMNKPVPDPADASGA